jgi:hypothetical protein
MQRSVSCNDATRRRQPTTHDHDGRRPKQVDELVAVWCERAELELRHKQPLAARDVRLSLPLVVFVFSV